jgi:hypothetical protein
MRPTSRLGQQNVALARDFQNGHLGILTDKLRSAVYDVTRHDKREEKPSRYELRDDVKDLCWQLLDPLPEKEDAYWGHLDCTPMERPGTRPITRARSAPSSGGCASGRAATGPSWRRRGR